MAHEENDSELIFVLTEDDVLELAREELGIETLTSEQMRRVRTGVSFGLEHWGEIVRIAIEEAIRE